MTSNELRERLVDAHHDNNVLREDIERLTEERDALRCELVDMSAKHHALLHRVWKAFVNQKMWSTTYVSTQEQADALEAVQIALNEGVYEVAE
jgi:hypothetical protein